jgi:hypothetical protein
MGMGDETLEYPLAGWALRIQRTPMMLISTGGILDQHLPHRGPNSKAIQSSGAVKAGLDSFGA